MTTDIRLADLMNSIRASLDRNSLQSCDYFLDVKSTGPKSVNVIVEIRYYRLFSVLNHYVITSIGPDCSFQKILDHVEAWAFYMSKHPELLKNGVLTDQLKKKGKLCLN
jgi:hypothetical protein